MNRAASSRPQPVPLGRVIVAGFGPVGRVVEEKLEAEGFDVTIVEMNPRTCEQQRARGKKIVEGDVTRPEVLREAGIEHADALVLAVPNEDVAVRACEVARELSPRLFISARTNFLSKGILATRVGANHVIVEEVVTAEAMRDAVSHHLRTAANQQMD